MTPIVTQCDETFLPGLKALHNSYQRNSKEGFEFYAILAGSHEFVDHVSHDLGINVIHDPVVPIKKYPTSFHYPVVHTIMYKNILMPELFAEHEKSIYIDTDSLILQNLQPLIDVDIGDKVLAATRCNGNQASNYAPADDPESFGPMTSLMIFNHRAWREKKITPRFIETVQREDITWHMIGQGALHFVVGDDWHELPWNTQAHAGHATYFTAPKKEVFTLHFMGTNPWCEFAPHIAPTERKLETRRIWQTYAS